MALNYDHEQLLQVDALLNACFAKHVTQRVLEAAVLIGVAENEWSATTCNTSNHCGVFQLDADWQRMHDYADTGWWAAYAIDHGFYGYGGLAAIDQDHPDWTLGQMVEACQGAGPTFAAAADYYDSRAGEALEVVATYAHGYQGHAIAISPTQPPAGEPTGIPAPSDYDPSPLIRAAFDDVGLHGRRAQKNAAALDAFVQSIVYVTVGGPHG